MVRLVEVTKVKLNNGQEMPALGMGTYMSKDIRTAIKVGIKVGYRMIDTAFIYRNEEAIGKAINERINEGYVKREDLFIISKLWSTHHEPEKVVPALKKTLKNLNTPYLDLYLIHTHYAFKGDDYSLFGEPLEIPIEDTWKAMEECVKLGLTKSIGISNFSEKQIEQILEIAEIKPVVNQVECNPFVDLKPMIDLCSTHGIVVMGYSPMYNAFKHFEDGIFANEKLSDIAKKYNKFNSQVTLRYLIQLGMIPLPKSDKPLRIRKNIDVFNFELTPEEMEALDKLGNERRAQHTKAMELNGFSFDPSQFET